ncbi:P2Y purinoceptor 1-like [Mytilus trossulus]|uniref:P2Y purinoceptor 1-like n=1 Tax=Mytilus trossulus TaxID=6551 RepID=UPI003007D348
MKFRNGKLMMIIGNLENTYQLMDTINRTTNNSSNESTIGGNPFSDSVIIWLYNESLYRNINLPCVIFLIVLAVFGIFGNSLVLYIYGFRFKRTNAHFFVLCLAVFDTMCCIAMLMEVFDKRFPMYTGRYRVLCKITRLTEMFSTVSSSLFLLCIALDRYYKICKPFKRFSYKKARMCLLICICISLVLSWPMLLFHGPETVQTGVKNVVGLDCGDDDKYKSSVLPSVYFGFMGVLNVVVIILLSFMYVRIFKAIWVWKNQHIGEDIPSSPVHVVSMNYRLSKVISKFKYSKKKRYNSETSETFSAENDENTDVSHHEQPNNKADTSNTENSVTAQNGKSNNGFIHERISRPTHFSYKKHNNGRQSSTIEENEHRNYKDRRHSTFSTGSGYGSRKGFKSSRTVTTNTVIFSTVTIVYIFSYLPTIIVETLNANHVYVEENLPNSTRSLLVLMNVTYFINNVANQYVYSAINPAFRNQVKQIFTGP